MARDNYCRWMQTLCEKGGDDVSCCAVWHLLLESAFDCQLLQGCFGFSRCKGLADTELQPSSLLFVVHLHTQWSAV